MPRDLRDPTPIQPAALRLNGFYRLLSLYGLLAGLACFVLFPGDPRWQLFACGQLAYPALLALPALMSRPIRLSDPLNLLVLSVTVGTVFGSAMLAFGSSPRRNFLMADWDVPDYAGGALMMLVSIALISLGYCMTRRRLRVERVLPRADHISEAGLQIGLLVGAAVSLLALASFMQNSGGFGLAGIGGKRAIELTANGEVVYAASGYTRLLASVVSPLLLMLLGYYLWTHPRLTAGMILKLGAVFLLSTLLPVLTSGRGALIQLAIGLLVVISAYRPVRVRSLVIVALVGLLAFTGMTALRSAAQGGGNNDAHSRNIVMKLAESGNGLAIASTTAVTSSVPERMPFQLGATMTTWIFAPVPRAVWPDKPDISLGKRIKEEIYRMRALRTGFPASVMAEGYMNFGLAGFLAFSLGFGALLRLVANSFLPVLTLTPFAPVLYYLLAKNVAGLANANLSQGIVRLLADLVTFALAFALLRYIVARRDARRRPGGLPAE